jgi:NAD(P)-dependent dehydrogenase (short-subunit alcohol dehydrogenase family)
MGSIADNHSGGRYGYRMSKAALNAVGKSLSVDLKPYEKSVALIHPGWVQTRMGGPNGLIDAQQSAKGVYNVIEQLTLEQTGQFFNYDGSIIPW